MSIIRGTFLSTGGGGGVGPAGPAGLNWLGVWSGATAYAVNDAIAWDGSSYICTVAHTNQEPPNASYWDVLAAAGVDGGTALPYAVELDDAGSGVTYVGKADPGTATSAAGWQIQRITETTGDLTIEWADGDALFNNVWDNHLSLSYS